MAHLIRSISGLRICSFPVGLFELLLLAVTESGSSSRLVTRDWKEIKFSEQYLIGDHGRLLWIAIRNRVM